jgi:hypothetical protein
MQLHRIVRESANPQRRVFYDVAEAARSLADELDPNESRRLSEFLAESWRPTP